MKKNNVSLRATFSVALLSFVLAAGFVRADEPAANAGGITDAEIQDVISRVARHQVHPLADGDYFAVNSVEEARAAKSPEGIIWNYP
jgi:hypothetical protein